MKKQIKLAALAAIVLGAATFTGCKKDDPVTPEPPAPPATPVITITTQPVSPAAPLTEGEITGSLTVAATVTEGKTLSYQWYSNTTNSSTGGTKETGATANTFTIPTGLTAGDYYYFCEVSAEGATAKRSNVAKVTVLAYTLCPAGEVAIALNGGTVTWAGSNLSGYQTFAANATDEGCLFQWGYDNALPHESGTGNGWHTELPTVAEFNPCPKGWRLPTRTEYNNLINREGTSSLTGTADGTYTATSWETGQGKGFSVTPKAGDTGKTLFMPNVRYRGSSSGNLVGEAYNTASYWMGYTGAATNESAWYFHFHTSYTAGVTTAISKLNAYPVRCVR